MEKFFEDPTSITEREILDALRAATIEGTIVPMVCGSSFKNKGVQTMLDLVMELCQAHWTKKALMVQSKDGRTYSRKPSYDEPFAALAFKIATDPYVGRLAFTRAYSGVLEAGSYVQTQEAEIKNAFPEYSKCTRISKILSNN